MSGYSFKGLKDGLSPDELKILKKTYWTSERCGVLFCYSRLMGPSWAYSMYPFMNWLYKDKDPEVKKENLKRQAQFWNCEAVMHDLGIGIIASMEKDHAETGKTTVESIEAVKAALIGPLSAIGDTFSWVIWRVLVTGIALNFCLQGSIIGPILFYVLYNAPKYVLRWYLVLLGYRSGSQVLEQMGESGMMQQLTKAASILGVFMMGGMITMMVKVNVVAQFSMNGLELSVADMFNSFLPGCLELLVTLIMWKVVKKKVNPVWIVIGTFVICILGAAIGLF